MPTKPFLDVPGYTGRVLKGGSTVLKKSREQRSGTFTPNKRDPSEFITVPNAGDTRLYIKQQNPPTSNAEGFTKNPAVFCPLLRAAPPKGGRSQHKAQRGERRQTTAKGIAYHTLLRRSKGEEHQSRVALARGHPYRAGRLWKCSFSRANSRYSASSVPNFGRRPGRSGCGTLRLNHPGPGWGGERASLRPGSTQTPPGLRRFCPGPLTRRPQPRSLPDTPARAPPGSPRPGPAMADAFPARYRGNAAALARARPGSDA